MGGVLYNMKKYKLSIFSLIILSLIGCQTTEQVLSSRVISLDGEYGTIAYKGSLTRIENGNEIIIKVTELNLSYVKDAT